MSEFVPTNTRDLQETARAVQGLLRSVVGVEGADDALQETWVKALERPARPLRTPRAWVRVVARNLAFDARRAERRRARRERAVARPEAQPAPAVDARLAAHRRVLQEVEALDEPLRRVIVARYFDGRSVGAIATDERVSRATVHRRLRAALAQLRTRLRGGARTWSPALLAVAGMAPSRASASGLVAGGGVAVASKTVVALVAASAVGFGAGWLAKPDPDPTPPAPPTSGGDADTLLAGAAPPPTLAVPPEVPEEAPATTKQPAKPTTPKMDAEALLARLNAVKTRKDLEAVCRELFRIPWADGYQMTLAIYERVNNTMSRDALLDIYTHPARNYLKDVVGVLALAMRDPDTKVSVRAHDIASAYVLENLAKAPDRAAYWQKRFEEATLGEVVREALHGWLARARRVEAKDVEKFLAVRNDLGVRVGRRAGLDLAAEARDAGALTLFERWWRDPAVSVGGRRSALQLVPQLLPDDAYLQEHVLPLIHADGDAPAALQVTAASVLARPKRPWALDPILRLFQRPALRGHWRTLAQSVGQLQDRRAIPTLIALLEAADTRNTHYDLGHFGLSHLTGVRYDAAHDAAWWRAWWEKARARYAPEIGALDIPELTVPALPDDDEEEDDSDAGDE